MNFKDYYKILGVDPAADSKKVKAAYRKQARKYHPDVSEHNQSEEKFKEINEAYEVLRDREKRAEYDEIRQYGRHGQPFEPPPGWGAGAAFQDRGFTHGDEDFSDFFSSIFGTAGSFGRGTRGAKEESIFGGRQAFNRRGQDIETDLPIFLEDTLAQESRTISYCLPKYHSDGRVSEINKTLNVKIPAGVSDGERIRLRGQGGPGVGDGASGDLYLRVHLVPHPLFDVEGYNLVLIVPLAPWEAALGSKIQVPTPTGKINLSIPANSQTGQRLRIKGKGLINKISGQVSYGDLYAVLKVVMPPVVNDEISQQWQQLAAKAPFDPRAEWSD